MAKVKSATEGYDPKTVETKTGKTMKHWHGVLHTFDVASKGHKAAADHLNEAHGVSFWWAQQIVIDFEQANGLRLPGQRSNGRFAVTVSRTIAVSPQRAFDAWTSADGWNSWFTTGAKIDFREGGEYSNDDKDSGTYRTIRQLGPPSSIGEVARIVFTWENAEHCPGSVVTVQFTEKGPAKTVVAVTHDKLPDQKGCEGMKEGWTWALTSLKTWLETGQRLGYETWKAGLASKSDKSSIG